MCLSLSYAKHNAGVVDITCFVTVKKAVSNSPMLVFCCISGITDPDVPLFTAFQIYCFLLIHQFAHRLVIYEFLLRILNSFVEEPLVIFWRK